MNPRTRRGHDAGRRPRASCPICCWCCWPSPPPLLQRRPGAAGSRRSPRSGPPVQSRSPLAAAVRRESAVDGRPGRDLRLLLLAGAGVSATAAVATAAGGSGALAGAPLLRLGLFGVLVVGTAARVPGWWSAPALAASATALAVVQAVVGAGTGDDRRGLGRACVGCFPRPAGARCRPGCSPGRIASEPGCWVSSTSTSVCAARPRSCARAGFDRREAKVRNLTPEGRRVSTLSAVVEIDRDLDRVLDLAALAVGARSVVLFLRADDGECLRVRQRRGRARGRRSTGGHARARGGGGRQRRADATAGALHEPRAREPAAPALCRRDPRALAHGRCRSASRAVFLRRAARGRRRARRFRARAGAAARGICRRGREAARGGERRRAAASGSATSFETLPRSVGSSPRR